jgi:hypothetical protein
VKKTMARNEKKEENIGEWQRSYIALREHIAEGSKKKSKKIQAILE